MRGRRCTRSVNWKTSKKVLWRGGKNWENSLFDTICMPKLLSKRHVRSFWFWGRKMDFLKTLAQAMNNNFMAKAKQLGGRCDAHYFGLPHWSWWAAASNKQNWHQPRIHPSEASPPSKTSLWNSKRTRDTRLRRVCAKEKYWKTVSPQQESWKIRIWKRSKN